MWSQQYSGHYRRLKKCEKRNGEKGMLERGEHGRIL